MITQVLMDAFSQMIAGIIGILPGLPPEAATVVGMLEDGLSAFGETAAYLSPIVPYSLFPTLISLYMGLLGVWVGYLILRVILWGVNR